MSRDRSILCEELVASAEQELTAFVAAVDLLFGPEQARRSAEDWLLSLQESAPGDVPDFRQLTIAAASELGHRVHPSL